MVGQGLVHNDSLLQTQKELQPDHLHHHHQGRPCSGIHHRKVRRLSRSAASRGAVHSTEATLAISRDIVHDATRGLEVLHAIDLTIAPDALRDLEVLLKKHCQVAHQCSKTHQVEAAVVPGGHHQSIQEQVTVHHLPQGLEGTEKAEGDSRRLGTMVEGVVRAPLRFLGARVEIYRHLQDSGATIEIGLGPELQCTRTLVTFQLLVPDHPLTNSARIHLNNTLRKAGRRYQAKQKKIVVQMETCDGHHHGERGPDRSISSTKIREGATVFTITSSTRTLPLKRASGSTLWKSRQPKPCPDYQVEKRLRSLSTML